MRINWNGMAMRRLGTLAVLAGCLLAGAAFGAEVKTYRAPAGETLSTDYEVRVTIRNVKLCNSRVQNDDGINPCNSQDVRITDCFIRSDDDCIALKGLDFTGENNNVEGIVVEDSILWCDRARIFLLGHESRAEFMRRVTFRNLDILHFVEVQFSVSPADRVVAQFAAGKAPPPEHPKPQPRLGMNLSGPADWNTELPFVDVFRLSRPWISQRKGQPWGKGPVLALDEHGWVKRLEADCWAETPLCTIEDGHYPSGEYTVLYDGDGQLDVWGAATVVSRQPGRLTLKVDASKGGFFLKLVTTEPANYVRNIRVIMPGFEKTYREEPFHPVFLKRWQGMACLRFMDWMETNGSKIRRWSERPVPEDATFSGKGVALETMIDLANRLKADPWFCMPHLADDEYVRNFAVMVEARLDKSRKVYVEYSNEVWNGMFPQSKYAGEQGIKLGFAEKPWEAAWRYTAYRSVQIFKIWEEVLGRERLVRVLPSQAANPYVSERIVEFRDAYKHADVLAIAPYISCNVAPQGKPSAADVEKWNVEQALDYMEQKALPESVRWIKDQKRVADRYRLRLVAYEGGQHMVGVGGAENNERLTKLLHAANRHPRMGAIYQQYYDAWTAEGGDLFCYFASTSRWSKWGSWGIVEWFDEDAAKSPKFMATMGWARRCGQQVNVP